VSSGFDRDAQLGADAVGRGEQNRIPETRRPGVEDRTEAAECGGRAAAGGRARQGLDRLDQRIAGIDVDAGVAVGQPVALASAVDGLLRLDRV